MVLGRAAKREVLKLFALAPERGEGGVRGLPEVRQGNPAGRPADAVTIAWPPLGDATARDEDFAVALRLR